MFDLVFDLAQAEPGGDPGHRPSRLDAVRGPAPVSVAAKDLPPVVVEAWDSKYGGGP